MSEIESAKNQPTFEAALAELERIVRDLEDGQLGLEASLARYEAGVGLLKHCYAQLRQAEQRILLLTGVDEEGRPQSEPFAHEATVQMAKTDSPGRSKRKPEDDVPF